MIRISKEYSIHCDNCHEPLTHPNDHPLTTYIGHVMTEGNSEHIIKVAQEYKWKVSNNTHVCPKCK